MKYKNIENAVRRLCKEFENTEYQASWKELSETKLLFELVACILGSQVSYELALAAAEKIRNAGLLNLSNIKASISNYELKIQSILKMPLHRPHWSADGKHYRFADTRAKYISRTVNNLYANGQSLRKFLLDCDSAESARLQIMKSAIGIGPKQASLFLRNIGYTDELAILDKHVLAYMGISGLAVNLKKAVNSLKGYKDLENILQTHARKFGLSLGYVDQAIWIVMRVYAREASI